MAGWAIWGAPIKGPGIAAVIGVIGCGGGGGGIGPPVMIGPAEKHTEHEWLDLRGKL